MYSFSAWQIAINMYQNDVPRKLASANAVRWHVACGMCRAKSALKKPQQQTKGSDIGL